MTAGSRDGQATESLRQLTEAVRTESSDGARLVSDLENNPICRLTLDASGGQGRAQGRGEQMPLRIFRQTVGRQRAVGRAVGIDAPVLRFSGRGQDLVARRELIGPY